mmetsp:Transcript_13787/g.20325  ORF Transcript_13787/g.20325 Transcript_13787/m.20325 type:complete len:1056 (-) Transcript_13787:190-3357(-)|eukprot:CAMPEP_0194205016 /NCGR_PEP_ID=MMETSP0156-20130528/4376_1 /TAXON_ID=33649 /ORGANISM="Thalassionema nitzschioides, Strain L26-B" /LENGTH=1055 /DNA_ID=CAMNT_0038931167 /DNA_START=67 /DNA_END=3234 /DNA_ORIENTATION=+
MTSTTPTATIAALTPPTQQQQDPNSLLDSLDAFSSNRAAVAAVLGAETNATDSTTDSSTLDPVDFINRHYTTEHLLISQLPSLRGAVNEREEKLQERISTALQRQSETSESTRRHVIDAKQSILSLEQRIRLVQEKAGQSERAVLEITKDMKRLDCAKRHLQKTITTLKQLHMLVNAIEQLRLASLIQPFPDYPSAAQLVDASRLLLQHFKSYLVPPMKLLALKVKALQQELLQGLLRGFRIAGFGVVVAMELEEGGPKSPTSVANPSSSLKGDSKTTSIEPKGEEKSNSDPSVSSSTIKLAQDAQKGSIHKKSILDTSPALRDDSDDEKDDTKKNDQDNDNEEDSIPIMTPSIMTDGILLIDALGSDTRTAFILTLCKNHLKSYEDLFCPKLPEKRLPLKAHSFKIATPKEDPHEGGPAYSLNQFERRFAWYRRKLREINDCYPEVFPVYWNFQYKVTVQFLEMTKTHLLALLEPGPTKDKESDNAQNLLIALQKTILFEKEMMAWLQRDFGTVFNLDSDKEKSTNHNNSQDNFDEDDDDDDENDNRDLEFDEEGRAVKADSAQGIRIKYERQRRERNKAAEKAAEKAASNPRIPPSAASREQVSVDPLVGCASSAFDDHMTPYIALEEQEMDERLVKALSDSKTDARGEFPVFTSSTDLFVYMKTSINRCKAMTKGKAFFLLHLAFQDSLNKYAQILSGKLPLGSSSTAMGGKAGGLDNVFRASMQNTMPNNSGNKSNVSYVIPENEEVTICYVISTCEYCADTIEALEDHISDAIDAEYKGSIDTTVQQENFHDVTAKCLKVLVSGLLTRCQTHLKTISTTDWSIFEHVGEESSYVHQVTTQILPFASIVRGHVPQSYFRSFCDKFAMEFTNTYYDILIKLKRGVNEMATQQLLLDIYSLKTCLMKIPVVEPKGGERKQKDSSTSLAPAMYTKMVTKQFKRIETLLKLVGTPTSMLIDVFRSQWPSGTALDLQTVMSVKGLKRQEQAQMLEQIGLDPATALKGATMGVTSEDIIQERVQLLRERSTTAVGRVTSDLSQMRQKVDDFRKTFSG